MDKRFPLEDQIEMLGSMIRGRVVTPRHSDYDSVRAVVPGNYDPRPAAVIRPATAADIATILNFARATDLDIAIRSGGHGSYGVTEGLVIDMRDLNAIEIDTEGKTAWAGTGLTAGEVTRAVEQHGLIVGFGDTASVGIGGLTSGGGIGYLVRKHGLTIDSVIAVEIVTAMGEILVADTTHHPDLFWAVRGGGGNFGVITRWKYQLHAMPHFTGGPLVLPATPEIVAGFVALAEAAPEELSAIALVMRAPPLPFLPAEMHGQTIFLCNMAFAGEPAAAEAALAPFRALATPIVDLVRPSRYSDLYAPEDPDARPSFSVRSRLLDTVGLSEARTIVDSVELSDADLPLGEIRVLGGAFARVSADATAFAHRNARVMVSFIAVYGSTRDIAKHNAWASDAIAQLKQGEDRVYVNFLTSDPKERLAAAYPSATLARLREIKRRYDPENMLRLNRNILPA
jgi:FAD/FMN-containing dehydrogenase